MQSEGFIEGETPILQPKAGGAIAKPVPKISTSVNTLNTTICATYEDYVFPL